MRAVACVVAAQRFFQPAALFPRPAVRKPVDPIAVGNAEALDGREGVVPPSVAESAGGCRRLAAASVALKVGILVFVMKVWRDWREAKPRAEPASRLARFRTAQASIAAEVDFAALVSRAAALGDSSSLGTAFESEFVAGGESPRGWANWLLEGRLMVGQYPHCQPARPGPSVKDAERHLRRVISAGVDTFVCLQAELPAQNDASAWPAKGVRFKDPSDRSRWPGGFVRYAASADGIAAELGRPKLRYLHFRISDLSVPLDIQAFYGLLSEVVSHYEAGGGAVYLHCWGGRGRAGLVGACVVSLLRQELDEEAVLQTVQAAYGTRQGASEMPRALQRSPQMEEQREFVRTFVRAVRAQR